MLLAVPALRALRRGAAELVLAAEPRIGALLAALGVVDRAVPFDSLGLHALFTEDPTQAPAATLAGARRVVCWFGAGDPVFARHLNRIAPGAIVARSTAAGVPVWRHLLLTLGLEPPIEERGATGDWTAPLTVPGQLAEDGRQALGASGWDGVTSLLMVHPGAGGAAKRWPAEAFAAALRALTGGRTLLPIVHQGPADAGPVAALLAALDRPVLRLTEPPLPRLAGALSRVAAYLGNDSGISHLAAALGVPSLVLLTEPMAPWLPWSAAARTLRIRGPGGASIDCDEIASVVAGVETLIPSGRERWHESDGPRSA